MDKFNEEDYLNSLLKSMDEKSIESDEDKQDRIIQEQIKDAVNKTNAQSNEQIADTNNTDQSSDSMNGASEINKDTTDNRIGEQADIHELSEEYKELFEPEDSNFKISDIPEREPVELTQSELDRLANMDLDESLEKEAGESVSVDQIFGAKDMTSINELSNSILEKENLEAKSVAEIAKSVTDGVNRTDDILNAADNGKKKKEKKKKEKIKKEKKNKILNLIKNIFFEEVEQPKQDSGQAVEHFVPSEQLEMSETPKDENERVLQELYGSSSLDNLSDEYKGEADHTDEPDHTDDPVKKGFFARLKAKSAAKKAKAAELERAAEEAEQLEIQKKKDAKAKKKEAAKNKKAQAKQAKASKPKKEKPVKVKKPKKPKKPKEPVRPQDMLKIKPISLVFLVAFVTGVVILVEISNTSIYYNNNVENAKLYFQNGNYDKAYNSLQGIDLKTSDQQLYNQITTIMYVEKQYTSYQNYKKLGMGVEALDSLVKGIQRYYQYYPTAKELGVFQQLDDMKAEIVSALKSTFSMSEEKAIGYASLSEQDFTQYYMTLESYGGMVHSDSNN